MDLTNYKRAKSMLDEIDALKSFTKMLSNRKNFNVVMDYHDYNTSNFLFLLPIIDARINKLSEEFKEL